MKLLKQRSTKITVWLGMLLSILILMTFGGMVQPVYAGGDMADCGPNLRTEYGGSPMVITIRKKSPSGSGKMYNSTEMPVMPWNSEKDEVGTIVIGSGVTDICPKAFKDMTKLENVFLPKSVKSIGESAFDGCTNLKNVYYFGTEVEMTSFVVSGGIGNHNNILLGNLVACDKGATVVNLSTKDGKPQKANWSKRYKELYNTLNLLRNENLLTWTDESSTDFNLDIDKDGKNDLKASFKAAESQIDSDQNSALLGKPHSLKISVADPANRNGMEPDYAYYSTLTFSFPKKFNGDKGKYTIDLTGGKAEIKDFNVRSALDESFSAAYNQEHSINATAFSATGVTYDIDMDGKGDVHFEYSSSGMTITKVSTCSLKNDKSIVLKTATKDHMNAVLDEYYGTVIFKMVIPKPAAKPTPALAPDGTAFGKGASVAAAEAAIATLPNDNDPKGSTYAPMRARSTKQTNKAIYLTWKKAPGAKKYVIYGSLCGTKYKMVKIAETTKKKYTVKKIDKKKLKKAKYYKFMIVAIDGSNKVVSTSKIVHAATDGGKYGNYKSITTKAEKLEDANELDLDVGKKFKLKGKGVKDPMKTKFKQHRKICYESTDPSVATVSKNGVVKGISEGDCYVYVYSQNGICVRIKVEVDA